ncbi:MAG: Dabb family protein [Bacteroidota bacterium]
MIRHIVMFRLKEMPAEEKNRHIEAIREMFDALPAIIPEIKALETGLNYCTRPNACDFVLVTAFEDDQALQRYRLHPEHEKIVAAIAPLKEASWVVDYEV